MHYMGRKTSSIAKTKPKPKRYRKKIPYKENYSKEN